MYEEAKRIQEALAAKGIKSSVDSSGGGFFHCIVRAPGTERNICAMADSVAIYNNEDWNDEFSTLWQGEEDADLTEESLLVIVDVVRGAMWLLGGGL